MKSEVELLLALYKMYTGGELAAEFDKRTNKMVNSAALQSIMTEVGAILPEELSNKEAAQAMRQLDPAVRDASIESAGDKVIDMRKEFLKRMSDNGGALGLTKQLVQAIADGDTEAAMSITANMIDLVEQGE